MSWKMKIFNSKFIAISLFSIVFLPLLLLVGCRDSSGEKQSRVDTLPFYSEATFTPQWLSPEDNSLNKFHRISPFRLINQEGDTLTERTFKRKIYVTDFFFTTCPGICPKMTENMGILHDEFLKDKEVLLLSHSVTPDYDSVAILKEYGEARGISSSKWHLVTGDRQQIYSLGRKDYFVEENLGIYKDEDDFLHTENFVLIDKNRHIRGIYNGLNKTDIHQLIADIKTLKKEK